MKVFNAELFAIEKAFKIAWKNRQLNTNKVWIFSDSQAAIKKLTNLSLKAGQYYIQFIRKWTKKFQDKTIQIKYIIHIQIYTLYIILKKTRSIYYCIARNIA